MWLLPVYKYGVQYLLTMMPGNQRSEQWRKGYMMRAIILMRDGVPTLKAVESCNIPITTPSTWKVQHCHFVTTARLSINYNTLSTVTDSVVEHYMNHSRDYWHIDQCQTSSGMYALCSNTFRYHPILCVAVIIKYADCNNVFIYEPIYLFAFSSQKLIYI